MEWWLSGPTGKRTSITSAPKEPKSGRWGQPPSSQQSPCPPGAGPPPGRSVSVAPGKALLRRRPAIDHIIIETSGVGPTTPLLRLYAREGGRTVGFFFTRTTFLWPCISVCVIVLSLHKLKPRDFLRGPKRRGGGGFFSLCLNPYFMCISPFSPLVQTPAFLMLNGCTTMRCICRLNLLFMSPPKHKPNQAACSFITSQALQRF